MNLDRTVKSAVARGGGERREDTGKEDTEKRGDARREGERKVQEIEEEKVRGEMTAEEITGNEVIIAEMIGVERVDERMGIGSVHQEETISSGEREGRTKGDRETGDRETIALVEEEGEMKEVPDIRGEEMIEAMSEKKAKTFDSISVRDICRE